MKRSKVTDYAALSGHSKIDKTKILIANCSLVKPQGRKYC